jgi:hypothetical protein
MVAKLNPRGQNNTTICGKQHVTFRNLQNGRCSRLGMQKVSLLLGTIVPKTVDWFVFAIAHMNEVSQLETAHGHLSSVLHLDSSRT